ncbi:hypothetical protein Bbelb_164180 [Branchiostoma belcheri]|nr:hypothetical protein Bbelb_164180 [Branchiostoma belcheri]
MEAVDLAVNRGISLPWPLSSSHHKPPADIFRQLSASHFNEHRDPRPVGPPEAAPGPLVGGDGADVMTYVPRDGFRQVVRTEKGDVMPKRREEGLILRLQWGNCGLGIPK